MKKGFFSSIFLLLSLSLSSCDFEEYLPKSSNDNLDSFETIDFSNQNEEKVEEKAYIDKIYFKEPHMEVIVGKKTKLEVCFEPKDYPKKDLSFTISNSSFGTITNDGYLTTKKAGSFTIKATGPYGTSAICTIISGSGPVESISTDSKINLIANEKNEAKINYKVYPDGAFQDIKTSIKDETIASIINDKVVANESGQTKLTIYDDYNHNDRYDEGEKFKDIDVLVHDYSEISNIVQATHEFDGSIVRICKCGCNKVKTETIPALGHDLDEGEIISEPTCTLSGTIRKKCTDPTCDYINDETIPALGHLTTEKQIKDKFLAKKGDFLNKSQYYYSCSRCEELTNETFEYGHHDDLLTLGIPNYYKDNIAGGETYKKALINTLNVMKENNEKTIPEEKGVPILYKDYNYTERKFCSNIIRTACGFGETFPWVDSNPSVWWVSRQNGYIYSLNITSRMGYHDAELRKSDMKHFDRIHAECDPLIREDATDVEKALIISLYTAKYITYDYNENDFDRFFFYHTAATGKGVCHSYALLVCHLAHRYNLPCVYISSDTHAWNNICIDGKWYLLDTTWSDTSLKYFLVTSSSKHSPSTPIKLIDEGTEALRDKLIQVYKEGEIDGIYYNLDTALKSIDDSDANYKMILGVDAEGILGFNFNSDIYEPYYMLDYETNVNSINCKSLKIERSKPRYETAEPTIKAPASFFNQKNISYKKIKTATK